jgi:hypothetical protein
MRTPESSIPHLPEMRTLFSARRFDEMLELNAESEYPHKSWHYRIWGTKALAAASKPAAAIRYAEDSNGLNAPQAAIAVYREGALLNAGFADEAYARYAVEATYATTNLVTEKVPAHAPGDRFTRPGCGPAGE